MPRISLDLRLALDRVAFARRVGITPDAYQERVLRSESKRIILNWCRQSGKSTICAVRALWQALYRPGSFVLVFSPSLDQSVEFFRKVREFYSRLDEGAPDAERMMRMGLELSNGSRVEARPGSEKTARGRTADLLIVDEAAKIDDALMSAVRPSLIVSKGALMMLSTPYGARGEFWRVWTKGVGWERHLQDAHMCERISDEDLEAERLSMLEHEFEREYLCRFEDATHRSLFGTMEDIEAAFISLDDAPEWQTGSLMSESSASEDLDALSVGDRRFWQALHERWYG